VGDCLALAGYLAFGLLRFRWAVAPRRDEALLTGGSFATYV